MGARYMKVLACAALILALWVSYAYPHDRRHPELDSWFMGLQSRTKTPCCDSNEAQRIEDADWESRDGHYRVRLDGEWVDVPDDAVVEGPNKAGPTLVWPYYHDGKLDRVRCFLPGSMT